MNEERMQRFAAHVRQLQDEICDALREVDPALTVREDHWERRDHAGDDGGGGRTRALTGDVIENGGVNTSLIFGAIDPAFAERLGGGDATIQATGISLILHPRNPRVPTVHANFRMIALGDRVWFGGGADLTPYYPHEADFRHFHRVWADACAPWGTYDAMKAWCDRYFVNAHREGEMRGIGGLFFDHWNTGDLDRDNDMVVSLSNRFLDAYMPIARARKDEPWTEEDEAFQLYRRGRYVEFNLLHDRGTRFGLETNGRTESILISLPARCRFEYGYEPAPESPHARMNGYYRPKDWLA